MTNANNILFILLVAFIHKALGGVGCGRPASGNDPILPSARIIGGSVAKRFSWPWMISQQVNDGHFCGGTLIRVKDNVEASDIILTAAHCVGADKIFDPTKYKSWTASANLYWKSYKPDVQTRNVLKAVDPGYLTAPMRNDIALLKLDKPINFTDTIRPVCLPKQGEALPVGRMCIAIGWGRNNSEDKSMKPEILQQTGSPVHSAQYCQQQWDYKYEESLMICAGAKDGSSGVCQGDSGGPLMCKADDGRWVQYGTSSFVAGEKCVEAGYPGIFGRVSNYIDWINTWTRSLTSL